MEHAKYQYTMKTESIEGPHDVKKGEQMVEWCVQSEETSRNDANWHQMMIIICFIVSYLN